MPKTGSSFLQRWLELNSDAVPQLPNENGGRRLAIECCDLGEFAEREDLAGYAKHFSMAKVIEKIESLKTHNHPRIVISSEYFYLAHPENINKKFVELGLNVEKIICFLGRQERMIASGFAQDVKELGRADPLILSPGGYTEWYDWLKIMKNYQSAFPAAKFVPIEFDFMRKTGMLLPRWKQEIGCTKQTHDIMNLNVNPSWRAC